MPETEPSQGFLNLPSVYFLFPPSPGRLRPPTSRALFALDGPPCPCDYLCRNSRAAWPGPVPARAAGLGHACGGRGSRLSAPGRCSPRGRPAPPGGCSPRPATPAGARLPRRQARDPAGRGAGLSLSIHRHPAAGRRRRRRLENSGEPAPWGWGRRELRGGTPPSRPRCDRGGGAARGAPGALPGGGAGRGRGSPPASSGPPARAPSRAESGRGARHSESPRGAGGCGSGATRAPGPRRRAALLPPGSHRPLGERVSELWVGGVPRSRPGTRGGRRRRRAARGRELDGPQGPQAPALGGDCSVEAQRWAAGRKDGRINSSRRPVLRELKPWTCPSRK